MFRSRPIVYIVAVLGVLGCADVALAWGPATHIALGATLLEQLSLIPAAVGAMLAKHGAAYLYGNIAADVVFAKRLSRVKQFCHHWSTGFRLLERAETDESKSFAYGYLSHLAADTVAHGKFVPRQVLLGHFPVNLGHFYWELRADATADSAAWTRLGDVWKADHRLHHRALEEQLRDTLLSFDVNRMLFDGINAMALRPGLRRAMRALNHRARRPLSPALMNGYHDECLDRMCSVLTEGSQSPLLREDPNGTSAFMKVHVHRRQVRRMRRRGLPTHHRRREASRSLAPSY